MMLKIRSALQGHFAKIILVLLMVPFSLVGMDLFFGGRTSRTIVEVEGRKISEEDIIQASKISRFSILEALRQQGEDVENVSDEVVRNLTLQELVRNTILEKQAEAFAMVSSEEVVKHVIVSMDAFQYEDNFSPYLYLDFLRTLAITPEYFEDYIAKQDLARQLRDGLYSTDFLTASELSFILQMFNEKRDIRYLRIPPSRYAGEVSVEEEEQRSFYEEYPDEFMTEEQVSVEYVELRLDDFYEQPREEEIEAEYRSLVESEEIPLHRKVGHILLRIEEEADAAEAVERAAELRERIEEGEDFAQLAREFSEDTSSAEQGGDMGVLEAGVLPSELEAALEEMAEGELSQPLRSDFGVHLLELREVRQKEYEELHDELAESLRERRAQRLFAEKKSDMLDIGFSAGDVEEISIELEIPVLKTEFFGSSGGEGISANAVFVEAAFSEEVRNGHNSDALELEPGHVAMLRALEYVAPKMQSFAEVQEEVKEILQQRGADEVAVKEQEELAQQLRNGADVETLARARDLEWYVNLGATRDLINVDAGILRKAFSLIIPAGADKSVATVRLADGDYVVLEVANVQMGTASGITREERENIKRSLLEESRDRNLSQYYRSLQAAAAIEMR